MPNLDEEIADFFKYIGMLNSKGLDQIKYQDLLDMLSEDYLIPHSLYADQQVYEPSDDDEPEQ